MKFARHFVPFICILKFPGSLIICKLIFVMMFLLNKTWPYYSLRNVNCILNFVYYYLYLLKMELNLMNDFISALKNV